MYRKSSSAIETADDYYASSSSEDESPNESQLKVESKVETKVESKVEAKVKSKAAANFIDLDQLVITEEVKMVKSASEDEESTSSDDFPSPNSPVRDIVLKNLLNKVKTLQEKIATLEKQS